MFHKRISSRTARLYRYAITAGINQARLEFNHRPLLPSVSAPWKPTDAPIGRVATSTSIEIRSYANEKRKRGWKSKPKDRDKSRNNNSIAVRAAAVSAIFT